MLKQFDKKDIDSVMKIWKDNNQKFQGFIDNQYWIDNYVKARDDFLNNKVYVYTEAEKLLAFIAISDDGRILSIQVKPEIQREGIGKLLIEKAKKDNGNLRLNIYEKNNQAVLFFKAMGFKKINESIENETMQNVYEMNWNTVDAFHTTFIYFDNSISSDIIDKYDKLNKVQFYNIHTFTEDSNKIFSIDISNELVKKNGQIYISDYVEVRNKLNGIIKDEKVIIFFDCNNDYSYLFEVIQDIAKVKGTNLTIVLHKPFSVEGSKKEKLYEDVRDSFKEFNVMDVDYEAIGQDKNISFKDAFDMRDEELVKMVCGQ